MDKNKKIWRKYVFSIYFHGAERGLNNCKHFNICAVSCSHVGKERVWFSTQTFLQYMKKKPSHNKLVEKTSEEKSSLVHIGLIKFLTEQRK